MAALLAKRLSSGDEVVTVPPHGPYALTALPVKPVRVSFALVRRLKSSCVCRAYAAKAPFDTALPGLGEPDAGSLRFCRRR